MLLDKSKIRFWNNRIVHRHRATSACKLRTSARLMAKLAAKMYPTQTVVLHFAGIRQSGTRAYSLEPVVWSGTKPGTRRVDDACCT
jgi:hypothetical protein